MKYFESNRKRVLPNNVAVSTTVLLQVTAQEVSEKAFHSRLSLRSLTESRWVASCLQAAFVRSDACREAVASVRKSPSSSDSGASSEVRSVAYAIYEGNFLSQNSYEVSSLFPHVHVKYTTVENLPFFSQNEIRVVAGDCVSVAWKITSDQSSAHNN